MRWLLTALILLPASAAAQPACPGSIAYSAAHRGTAVLVIQDGKTVCRSPTEDGEAQELWSGTKSIVGLAAAAAVQDGLLKLDDVASNTLVEWNADLLKHTATIRQLLSMTAGLPSQVGKPPGYAQSLAIPFNAAPGMRFQYGPAPMQAFGELLTRKLRASGSTETVQAYIERRILNPIGLNVARWRIGGDGNALLPQGLVLTASEWAKIGHLVLERGRVAGRPIVDSEAFEAMFRGSAANPSYGLTWWLAKGPPNNDVVTNTVDVGRHGDAVPADLVLSAGAGNQRLYVIPSLRMIIVRQAVLDLGAFARPAPVAQPTAERWSDTAFLGLVLAETGNAGSRRDIKPSAIPTYGTRQ